jgi:hypothetical protein
MNTMTARPISIWLTFSVATCLSSLSCDRAEKTTPPRAKPSWVSRVDLVPLGTKPAFDGNVELVVTLTNKSQYPVVMDRLDKDGEVQLAGIHGAHAALHPLSVGVAKPILLAPGDTVRSSLLFKRLDEPAEQLEVYGTKRSVANAPGSP